MLYGIFVSVGASCSVACSTSLCLIVFICPLCCFAHVAVLTIAIGIINAYMLVLCLYMCIYIVCVAVPCLSCAGDQAVTVRKLSLCLCLYGLCIRFIDVETENFNL